MKLYNVTFTKPFFDGLRDMPVKDGTVLHLTKKQISALLDRYNLGYYADFMRSGKADDWIADKGAWSQQVNGWFITVKSAA